MDDRKEVDTRPLPCAATRKQDLMHAFSKGKGDATLFLTMQAEFQLLAMLEDHFTGAIVRVKYAWIQRS